MVDNRLKPLDEQHRAADARETQRLRFRRNQAIGLLLAAAAVFAYRVMHVPSGWLFPQGWWRW